MSGKNNIGDLILYGRSLNIQIFEHWRRNPRMSSYSMPSAKLQVNNMKHGGGIRLNVCNVSFAPPHYL
jgi:hypothetical protein